MSEFDPGAFPLMAKGRLYEDFTVGQVLVHHWGRTLTAGDNALFSTATCNWNPMHLNAEYARLATELRDRVAAARATAAGPRRSRSSRPSEAGAFA